MTAPIFVQHSEFSGIEISRSRDGNRISVDVKLKTRGVWTSGGPMPSFPASMLNSVIEGLVRLRDSAGGAA
jgi:hypothetical protein